MKLTQRQVYDALLSEAMLRYSLKDMYPGGPDYDEEKLRRKSIIWAVQHTWEWYNKQDLLRKRLIMPIKDEQYWTVPGGESLCHM